MTVMGLDAKGDVVLLVVEKSHRSRGITVAEAARLLRRRFDVRDAIVLGAAGDSQLATTAEGFLTVPLVADYAKATARRIPDDLLCAELEGTTRLCSPGALLRGFPVSGRAAGSRSAEPISPAAPGYPVAAVNGSGSSKGQPG